MADRRGQNWTRAEEATLIELVREDKTLGEIAQIMGRSPYALIIRLETIAREKQRFDAVKKIIKEIP